MAKKSANKREAAQDFGHLLDEIVSQITNIYGNNLERIILYGSYARNEASKYSDIDIAFVVIDDEPTIHDRMLDILSELDLEYNQVISPSVIEIAVYNNWKDILPYYRNIENEGIVLWKAA